MSENNFFFSTKLYCISIFTIWVREIQWSGKTQKLTILTLSEKPFLLSFAWEMCHWRGLLISLNRVPLLALCGKNIFSLVQGARVNTLTFSLTSSRKHFFLYSISSFLILDTGDSPFDSSTMHPLNKYCLPLNWILNCFPLDKH